MAGTLNMGTAKGEEGSIVKVGAMYVRDYPARFRGDYTLTTQRSRAATFHVVDLSESVVASLTAALGGKAEVVKAKAKKVGGR